MHWHGTCWQLVLDMGENSDAEGKMRQTKPICTLVACAALIFAAASQAAPTVRLTSGGSSLTLNNHSADARYAEITSVWSVGDWSVSMNPASSAPRLDILSGQFQSNVSGTYLDVEVSDTDFSLAGLGALSHFIGSIGGATSGSATWWMYVDDGNAAFSRSMLVGSGSTTELGMFSGTFSSMASVDGAFSMTLLVRINHGNGPNETSFNYAGFAGPQQVPEPATLLLLALGLLAIALVRRRKNR
jgi:hypothetical protein